MSYHSVDIWIFFFSILHFGCAYGMYVWVSVCRYTSQCVSLIIICHSRDFVSCWLLNGFCIWLIAFSTVDDMDRHNMLYNPTYDSVEFINTPFHTSFSFSLSFHATNTIIINLSCELSSSEELIHYLQHTQKDVVIKIIIIIMVTFATILTH